MIATIFRNGYTSSGMLREWRLQALLLVANSMGITELKRIPVSPNIGAHLSFSGRNSFNPRAPKEDITLAP